eukprot:TRINITY_DN52722_c0_g1_i1.p2 TRINITY_DN52722_c0_g1~~TRINITY_DN52722_c0_g1_i1.p2  ORF type:complete len:119 (-),score=7.54 TRINITY_DN52722_c0_g1_i1:52-408(-)
MKKVTCISEKHMPFHYIRSGNGKLEFIFLPGGGLYEIHDGELMLNLFSPSIFDKSTSNLYLRIFTANGIEYHAMLDGSDPNKGYSNLFRKFQGSQLQSYFYFFFHKKLLVQNRGIGVH